MEEWKTICTVNNQMEAEILRGYLESQGIKVLMRGEAAGQVYGLSSGPLAEVDILVAKDQYQEAEKALEEFQGHEA